MQFVGVDIGEGHLHGVSHLCEQPQWRRLEESWSYWKYGAVQDCGVGLEEAEGCSTEVLHCIPEDSGDDAVHGEGPEERACSGGPTILDNVIF